VFDEHRAVREEHGATGHIIYRSLDDPNLVTVVNAFPSAEAARAFTADPSLPEAMHRAGVDSDPHIEMDEQAEDVSYQTVEV
jgi:hypothetical protein